MDAQRHDHGRRLRAVIGNLVARANLHRKPFRPAQAEPCRTSAKNTLATKFHSFVAQRPIVLVAAIVAGQRPLSARVPRARPASAVSVALTATFMAIWSDAVPNHVPCSGIASRGSFTTATRTRF